MPSTSEAQTSEPLTRTELLQRLRHPQDPSVLLPLLRSVGITYSMIRRATDAASDDVVANWRNHRSAPREEQYRRLDGLRAIVSFLLTADPFEDEGLYLPQWLNGFPPGAPFEVDGDPRMTPLDAVREDMLTEVADAAHALITARNAWRAQDDQADEGRGTTEFEQASSR